MQVKVSIFIRCLVPNFMVDVYISLTDDFVLWGFPVDMVSCLDSSPVRMAVVSLSIHACLSLSLDAWKLLRQMESTNLNTGHTVYD